MIRSVFVGSRNRFTEIIVHWLSQYSVLTGVVWTSSAHWQSTLSGRAQFLKKRLKRVGLLKAVDEGLYFALARNFLKPAGEPFQRRLCDAYIRQYGSPEWHVDEIQTDNINAEKVREFIRERSPDVIMSMCINEFFRKALRQIPKLGVFLWHEGLCPEYKGLYSPFWAVHNGEPEMLGYTVLRMNDRYDEGEVYLQGPVRDVDPRTDSFVYIGHKAILDSLPAVSVLFEELENGTAKPMSMEGREPGSYTYPGLTDWLRFQTRLRNLGKEKLKKAEA